MADASPRRTISNLKSDIENVLLFGESYCGEVDPICAEISPNVI
jgi:hypothetical protein